jgi:hypothetical protein
MAPIRRTEHDEQASIIEWASRMQLERPELGLLFAIPNGAKLPYRKDAHGRRYSPQAQKLKAEGLRSGVPDLFLPVARGGFHGMFIELKVGRNRPSEVQAEYLDRLAEQGYYAAVCWGAEDAIGAILAYLG